jgi:hypothetical protein
MVEKQTKKDLLFISQNPDRNLYPQPLNLHPRDRKLEAGIEDLNEEHEMVVILLIFERPAKTCGPDKLGPNGVHLHRDLRPALCEIGDPSTKGARDRRTGSGCVHSNGCPDRSFDSIVHGAGCQLLEFICPEEDQVWDQVLPNKMHEIVGEGMGKLKRLDMEEDLIYEASYIKQMPRISMQMLTITPLCSVFLITLSVHPIRSSLLMFILGQPR